jgi:hypothetical protein
MLCLYLVVDFDAVAKNNRIRDFHHGGLHMQRHHEALGLAVFNLLGKELHQMPPDIQFSFVFILRK